MICADQIPDEVADAIRHCFHTRGAAKAEIAAALAAWPMMKTENREVLNFGNNIDGPVVSAKRVPFIILPLTENTDAEG